MNDKMRIIAGLMGDFSTAQDKEKAKRVAYEKARYIAHREEYLAYQKAYAISHKEEIKARKKVYQAKHREKLKDYMKAYYGSYYKAHREEIRAKHASYRVKHREELRAEEKVYSAMHHKEKSAYAKIHRNESRDRELKRNYGISLIEFDTLLKSQGGVCAICGKVNWNGRGPVVDHEHVPNGKVRGILCNNCNMAIGQIHDDPKISQSMTNYLERAR